MHLKDRSVIMICHAHFLNLNWEMVQDTRAYKWHSKKLQFRWLGPFTIISVVSDLLYKIQEGPRSKPKVVHVNRLEPYQGNLRRWYQPQGEPALKTRGRSQKPNNQWLTNQDWIYIICLIIVFYIVSNASKYKHFIWKLIIIFYLMFVLFANVYINSLQWNVFLRCFMTIHNYLQIEIICTCDDTCISNEKSSHVTNVSNKIMRHNFITNN